MIWRALPSDIPTLLAWARDRYGALDELAAARWAKDAMENPEALVLIGQRVAGVALIAQPFWGGAPRCHLIALFGQRAKGLSLAGYRESAEIMRMIDRWRQVQGAETFHFGAETGARFKVLAKALGATEDPPSFTLGGTAMSFAADMFRRQAPVREDHTAPLSVLEQILGARA